MVALEPERGREIGKTRPALVISNNVNNRYAGTVTVLPVTSRTEKIYPFEALLTTEETGLPKESKVKCNQIRTVDKERLVKCLGLVPPDKMRKIETSLLLHLDIQTE